MELPVIGVIITLAIILMAAKVFGELFERVFKLPSVMGELSSGILLGYHALGGIPVKLGPISIGQLFSSPITDLTNPTNTVMFSLGQVGAIVLLFYVGLQIDINTVLASGKKSFVIAIAGVLLPFSLGFSSMYLLSDLMPAVPSNLFAMALFVGAILTATSVSVTARLLEDAQKLDSVEGTTILSAAVIDDVLGILILIMVVGLTTQQGFEFCRISGLQTLATCPILKVSAMGTVFLAALVYGGLKLHAKTTAFIKKFKTPGSVTTIAVVSSLIGAYVAEKIGLALIIGAFSTGLFFSKTDVVHTMKERIKPISFILVPVFFSSVGMLIDIGSLLSGIHLAIIITVLAIVGKLLGCGIAAKSLGFSKRQALIIGVGMIPRGEVALIIEAYALIVGIIPIWIFGTVAFMTLVTTFIAPIILSRLFKEEVKK
ncbi:MAG: cation:proton antiporter [Candidatus Aenigmarchaeota archaeon]|nr:cation:proton antiporter [Candidatus Aenigmarchaeota archaeon]